MGNHIKNSEFEFQNIFKIEKHQQNYENIHINTGYYVPNQHPIPQVNQQLNDNKDSNNSKSNNDTNEQSNHVLNVLSSSNIKLNTLKPYYQITIDINHKPIYQINTVNRYTFEQLYEIAKHLVQPNLPLVKVIEYNGDLTYSNFKIKYPKGLLYATIDILLNNNRIDPKLLEVSKATKQQHLHDLQFVRTKHYQIFSTILSILNFYMQKYKFAIRLLDTNYIYHSYVPTDNEQFNIININNNEFDYEGSKIETSPTFQQFEINVNYSDEIQIIQSTECNLINNQSLIRLVNCATPVKNKQFIIENSLGKPVNMDYQPTHTPSKIKQQINQFNQQQIDELVNKFNNLHESIDQQHIVTNLVDPNINNVIHGFNNLNNDYNSDINSSDNINNNNNNNIGNAQHEQDISSHESSNGLSEELLQMNQGLDDVFN